MYRTLATLAGIALIAASAVAATRAPVASADVVRSSGCIFFDANGTPWFDAESRLQIVSTNNPRGNQSATCQGTLPAGAVLPDRAMHFDNASTGYVCLAGDDWKMTVSPSGQASFTCHVPI